MSSCVSVKGTALSHTQGGGILQGRDRHVPGTDWPGLGDPGLDGQQGPSKPCPKRPPPASVCEKSCSLRTGSSLLSTTLLLAQCPQQPSWLERWAKGWLGLDPTPPMPRAADTFCSTLRPALLFCRSSGALICRWARGCPCASQHPRRPAIATCLRTANRR